MVRVVEHSGPAPVAGQSVSGPVSQDVTDVRAGYGKSVRDAAGGRLRPHLLAAVAHEGSIVLAQRQIPDKGSEISELAALVAELDLAGKVITVDALHTPAGPPRNTSCRSKAPTTS